MTISPELITAIQSNLSTTILEFTRIPFDPSNSTRLSQALSVNTTATHLFFRLCDFRQGTAASWEFLKQNKTIKVLMFKHCQLTEENSKQLREALKANGTLEELKLFGLGLDAKGFKVMGVALATHPTLRKLDLSSNKLGPEGAAQIGTILASNKTLESLNLTSNNIGPQGCTSLCNGMKIHPNLTHLDISCNQIGDEGAKSIGDIISSVSLRSLFLQANAITDISPITHALANHTSLRELHFDHNTIGLAGMQKIADMIKTNRAIETLSLLRCVDENRVETGMRSLVTALEKNTTLTNVLMDPRGGQTYAALQRRLITNKQAAQLKCQPTPPKPPTQTPPQTPPQEPINPKQPSISDEELEQQIEKLEYSDFEKKLTLILKLSKNKYKPGYANRLNNAKFINKCLSSLLFLYSEELKERFSKSLQMFLYLAHLNDVAGIVSNSSLDTSVEAITTKKIELKLSLDLFAKYEELEGWDPLDFFPLRIGFLLELFIKIETDVIPADSLPAEKSLVKEKLLYELITELSSYYLRANFILGKQWGLDVKPLFEECAQSIAMLKDGQEFSVSSGYSELSGGHALYVSFIRRGKDIIIRVDNQGDGSKDYHETTTSDKGRSQIVGVLPLADFESKAPYCLHYIEDICEAISQPRAVAFFKIYTKDFEHTLSGVKNNYPFKKLQTVGNCVVKNHNVGLQFRMTIPGATERGQRRLYEWMRNEERKALVEKKHFKEYQYAFDPKDSFASMRNPNDIFLKLRKGKEVKK